MRYKGSVISATPPTISTSSAIGVWTLVQQLQAQGAGTWPAQNTYWIGRINSASNQSVAVAPSGNIYIGGYNTAGNNSLQASKYNSSGVIQWQKTLPGGATNNIGQGVAIDSSENVYVVGASDAVVTPTNDYDVLIAKYNISGTLQWQRLLGITGTNTNDIGYAIAVDGSSNVYVSASSYDLGAAVYKLLIAKYDTSGTIQWQRTLSGASNSYTGIALDSANNVYACIAGGTGNAQIVKYDTSGTIQWQKALVGSATSFVAAAVDSSGNIYFTGSTSNQGAGLNDVIIAKYDTSGTLQWQRILGGTSQDYGYGIAVDSSGNAYVTGCANATYSPPGTIFIAKYNTSGTIQWQRTLSSSNAVGWGITVDAIGNYYVAAQFGSFGLIIKLPGDGSLTGTYGTYTYAASSFTAATSTLTSSTTANTDAAGTLTGSTPTFTNTTSTATYTITTVP